MVSAVLASLLQSYLGKYLELSDTSISVGSEVRLKNVRLRESAFTDLVSDNVTFWGGNTTIWIKKILKSQKDETFSNVFRAFSIQGLPIKCVDGKVSKLVIKIPWFNIFTKSTTIEIEGVHLLIVPSTSVSYDENKERDLEQEAKQKRLQVQHPCQFSCDALKFHILKKISEICFVLVDGWRCEENRSRG